MEREILIGHTKETPRRRGGYYNHRASGVFVEVEVKETPKGPELSICGSAWLPDGRDCYTAGQCLDHLAAEVATWAPGWSAERFARVVGVWERWHLNGMRAGCEHQRAAGWRFCSGHPTPEVWIPNLRRGRIPEGVVYDRNDNGIFWDERVFYTIMDCAGQAETVRLAEFTRSVRCSLDTMGRPCPECGYKHGSAWLHEALPPEIIEEVKGS
jgi:hypothetical protein